MTRLPGDPNPVRWLLFAIGFRLPTENLDWVRHELTDAGWRGRTVRRLFVPLAPVCVALAFLPGPLWLRITVPAFAVIASVGTVLISADDVRAARLRQHGLPVPLDKDLNRPAHLLAADGKERAPTPPGALRARRGTPGGRKGRQSG